jgi:hypothetical protein
MIYVFPRPTHGLLVSISSLRHRPATDRHRSSRSARSQIDLMGDDHETALYKAAAAGHAKIIDALVAHEAAPPNLEARAKVGRDWVFSCFADQSRTCC